MHCAPGSWPPRLSWCAAGVHLSLIPLSEADLRKLEAKG